MLRFQSLDGWRGIAAVFVSLYHFSFFNHLYDWSFLRNSYLFVDFFFVLSGFVITHAYHNKLESIQDNFKFILRRLSRLLPLHLFILTLFVILELLKLLILQFGVWEIDTAPFTGEYSIHSLISNIFLLQSMGIHNHLSWNYPSWSISVEFYTYLIFSIVTIVGFKFRSMIKIQYFILIIVSFYIVYTNTDNLNDASYNFGIFRCIIGFFLGSTCYQFFLMTKNLIIPQATLLEIGLIILIYMFTTFLGKENLSIFAPILFTLTVYVFSFEQGFISGLLKMEHIQNLGKWSYSIYMVHALIILIIGRGINFIEKISGQKFTIEHTSYGKNVELFYYDSSYLMDFFTVIYLFILIYISSLTYRYIELKGSKFLNLQFRSVH